MGVHRFFARIAPSTGSDTRNQHSVAGFEIVDARADFFYNSDPFVSKRSALGYRRYVTAQDM
ncbi:hypothetical protein EFBL_0441 [Effusibacillus lacus]|uniref:Uncharacterized protein n=1 Tax=Effusibacillus lacus TaxID=1348429 RepID=A0A292YFJ2_9BACL|nr:hypothetical protein EFBL_0441 [Effusibacillus lacus]